VVTAAMITTPAFAAKTPTPPIDINAPVHSGTQCMPCHATIAGAKTPGHIFQHGSHMTLSCDACHWAPPHSGGVSVLPPMQSCFNCHGLKHNGKEIARSACPTCHTLPRAQLLPKDHGVGYKARPHADAALKDTNLCLMCHDAAWCDTCHVNQSVKTPATQPEYRPLMPDKPRRPAIDVAPDGLVTIGECVQCHPDLDAYVPGRVIFAHASHLQKAFKCADCHRTFAHGPDTTARPSMPTCYQCHGLTHARRGLVATEKCATCHPKDFVLRPTDHTAAFVKSAHKIAANTSPEQCAMCHAADFCTACHQGRPKVAGGPLRPQVIPADHRLGNFRLQHGKDFLAQKGACGSCHDSPSCEKCHTTPMPHPADWTTSHPLATGLDAQDCKVCHTNRQTCQECHHRALRGAELVLSNCVTCHKVLATTPATSIKPSSMAEHAVHFIVAKKQGKAYRCERCHVGFGYSAVQAVGTQAPLNRGHDLSSCYECHGALDYRNVQIAPYPGGELCRLCHANLNL
jgi:hypothetical protein